MVQPPLPAWQTPALQLSEQQSLSNEQCPPPIVHDAVVVCAEKREDFPLAARSFDAAVFCIFRISPRSHFFAEVPAKADAPRVSTNAKLKHRKKNRFSVTVSPKMKVGAFASSLSNRHTTMLTPEEHYARLATKRVSVAVLLFHEGRILIVEPTYEVHHLMPGGSVDKLETPREAALRECKEELGIDVEIVRLLGVDHTLYPEGYRADCLHFSFLARDLTKEQVAAIRLPSDELKSLKWVTPTDAYNLLGNRIRLRTKASLDALREGTTFYSENGRVF